MSYLVYAVLCLILAAIFIWFEHKKMYVPAVVFKGLASFTFVMLGLLSLKLVGVSEGDNLVIIGLMLGCIADILLNLRFVFEKNGQKFFLVGILVFLSGHIFYLVSLAPKCRYLWVCIIAGIILTAVVLKLIFMRISAKKAFKIFGIFYIGAIMIMSCIAFGVLLTVPTARSWAFFVGAVLFLVSDIVLILNTFGQESKFSLRITNLGLYYVGQILIAISLQLT